MTLAAFLVVLVGGFLAYVNGANDVSKGIATLVGSGVADYRRAIAWGGGWTAAGGLFGALFAGAMLANFGTGLVVPTATPTFAAALAAVVGAAGWVLVATRTEMIGELSLAMTAGLPLGSLAKTIHPYPTQAEVWKRVADAYQRSRLTPAVRSFFERFLRWRR